MLLALGTMLSGMIANRIFHDGATLLEFKVEIVVTVACWSLLVLGPLIVFYPQLRAARRKGMIEYGALGQRYAREFNHKWLRGPRPADDHCWAARTSSRWLTCATASTWCAASGWCRSR